MIRLSHDLMMCEVAWEKLPSRLRMFLAAIGLWLLLMGWIVGVYVLASAVRP